MARMYVVFLTGERGEEAWALLDGRPSGRYGLVLRSSQKLLTRVRRHDHGVIGLGVRFGDVAFEERPDDVLDDCRNATIHPVS